MRWVLLAAGIGAGMAWWRALVIAAVLMAPAPVAGVLLIHAWRGRRRRSVEGAVFCDAVSAELRAGATVRAAVEAAGRAVGAERLVAVARSGTSPQGLASEVAERFPEVGGELREVLSRGDGLGVAPAALFDEIATLALAQAEVAAEVAAASAPARATALVLLGAPLLAVAWVLGSGGLGAYLAHPVQRSAALVGLVLVGLGVTLSVIVVRRR